ncbi:major Facilitator Superfamily protein [bacterium BMS3Abin05]|nr:major Facilitator Superfamily protein [bacterium BMS3Abin05]GBE26940.1 major Facilitator Superfamily protein [bacterium BMS3Bbin03]
MIAITDTEELSPAQKKKGQRAYLWFNRLNALSYAALADSILILYAIKLGAGDPFIAVLSSLVYFTSPFTMVGKHLIGKLGAAKNFGTAWFSRNVAAALMILVPIVRIKFSQAAGLELLFIAAFLFFSFRSIGGVAMTPLMGEITSDQDRGTYISRVWLNFSLFYLLFLITITIVLGLFKGIRTFQSIIFFGVVTGIVSSFIVYRVPESKYARLSGQEKLSSAYKHITQNITARRLLITWIALTTGMMFILPISVLALKKGYSFSDHQVLIFIVIQLLGSIYASYTSKLILDQVGSRPMIILCAVGFIVVELMWILAPARPFGIYLGILFFLIGVTNSGSQISLLHYFLNAVPPSKRVSASMFINMASGFIAGLAGSILAGGILKLLHSLSFQGMTVYKSYFGIVAIAQLFIIWSSVRLISQKERRIFNVLGMFFSFRDWRAIYTLQKFVHPTQESEDMNIITKLQEIGSDLGENVLVHYLTSPVFTIRGKALQALGQIRFSPETAKRIIQELQTGEFTTAYLAAEVLGDHQIKEAIPFLRNTLHSQDLFLQGKSMLALGRLQDEPSFPDIIHIFQNTGNPRILIYGVRAIVLMKKPEHIGILLNKIVSTPMDEQVSNELLYGISEIADAGEAFYRFYNLSQNSMKTAALGLSESLEAQLRTQPVYLQQLQRIANHLQENSLAVNQLEDFYKHFSDKENPILNSVYDFLKAIPEQKVTPKLIAVLILIGAKAISRGREGASAKR